LRLLQSFLILLRRTPLPTVPFDSRACLDVRLPAARPHLRCLNLALFSSVVVLLPECGSLSGRTLLRRALVHLLSFPPDLLRRLPGSLTHLLRRLPGTLTDLPRGLPGSLTHRRQGLADSPTHLGQGLPDFLTHLRQSLSHAPSEVPQRVSHALGEMLDDFRMGFDRSQHPIQDLSDFVESDLE
jgi:hypothetical protein